MCLLSADSQHELRAILPIGSRLPLPQGSSGRLLAADEETLAELAEGGWIESVGIRTPGLGSMGVEPGARTPVCRDQASVSHAGTTSPPRPKP